MARQLASILKAPCYELDHIGYHNHSKRPLEERLHDVRQIAAQPSWVSEGGYLWWVDGLLQNADMVVWLDLHWTLCYRRIVLRHIRADLARTNTHPGFVKMLRFAKGVRPYYLNPNPGVPTDPMTTTRKTVLPWLRCWRLTRRESFIAAAPPTSLPCGSVLRVKRQYMADTV